MAKKQSDSVYRIVDVVGGPAERARGDADIAVTVVARAEAAAATRVIQEVPGDPCNLTITAQPDGQQVRIETAPLRDCSGNPIPDGTIVTFTANYNGMQSTVDVPLRHDVARVDMPACIGATISAASGVVAGNQIRWEGSR